LEGLLSFCVYMVQGGRTALAYAEKDEVKALLRARGANRWS